MGRKYIFNKDGSPARSSILRGAGSGQLFHTIGDHDEEHAREREEAKARLKQAEIDREVAIRVAVEKAKK